MKRLRYFLLFLIVFPFTAHTQNSAAFSHISLREGLSQSVVLDVLQDSAGFLWAATQDGLNRFDGNRFIVYRHSPNNNQTIADNWVNACLMRGHTMFIAAENGGLGKLDVISGIYSPVAFDCAAPVRAICFDKNDALWAGTWGKGVYLIRDDSQKPLLYANEPTNPHSISNNRVRTIHADQSGNIWLGTDRGLNLFDHAKKSFTCFLPNPSAPLNDEENVVTDIKDASNNALWICTAKGVWLFAVAQKKFLPVIPTIMQNRISEYATCCLVDSKGDFWFGTMQSGLFHLKALLRGNDKVSCDVEQFVTNQLNPGSLNCNYVRHLYEDRSRNLWVGTWGGGLNRLNLKAAKFIHVGPTATGGRIVHGAFVRAFHKDASGNLLIGFNGDGLDFYDRIKGTTQQYKFTSPDHMQQNLNYVYVFHDDQRGNVWVGTFGGLICWPKDNPSSGKLLQSYQMLNKTFSASYIRAILNADENNLLLGTGTGLAIFNTVTRQGYFLGDHAEGKSLPQLSITTICQIGPKDYWVGSPKGLWHYRIEKNKSGTYFISKAESFIYDQANPASLSSNKVNCVYHDSRGVLWIGTNLGLNKLNADGKSFTRYLRGDGLPNDIINGILEDEQGALWMSTNKGIARMQLIAGKPLFRTYDETDGLQSDEFNQGAYYKASDGELFFGGINGYNSFYPSLVSDNQFLPPVAITGVRIGSHPADGTLLQNGREVEMKYSDGSITFQFSALDFTNPEKNNFRYQMEGFDGHVIDAGTGNSANYTNLDPGNYTFHVFGSNDDRVWNPVGAAIRVTITPPFHMTFWFRGLIVLLIAGMIYGLSRVRFNRLLAIERLRMKIAGDLHDEIGSLFTTITLYAGRLRREHDMDAMKSRAEKIEALSRDLISSMSDIVWSIDARNDTIGDMLDRMRDLLNMLFHETDVTWTLNTEGLDTTRKMQVEIRQNIYRIFKEAVTNILKHARATEVQIVLTNSQKHFRMTISDNGLGFRNEAGMKGNGLRNMKTRAEKINGTLDIATGAGISLTITTPAL